MTKDEKLSMLYTLIDTSGDASLFSKLDVYLDMAEREILAWRYSYSRQPMAAVPIEYEMTQIQAVLAGFGLEGAENQTQHSENGITRTFKYPDMIAYIRANVIPVAGVL
jgi:hypothetical protein